MAKLIVKLYNEQVQFAPLITNPIKESEISEFKNDLDNISQALPIEKPGTLTIDNVTYKAYNSQKLQVDIPGSSKDIFSVDVESSNKTTTYKKTTVTVDPLKFSNDEQLSLVEILTVLARASHTHTRTKGGTVTQTSQFDITPSIPSGKVLSDPGYPSAVKVCKSYCPYCNNDCNNNGQW